jgi:hypothetical protein
MRANLKMVFIAIGCALAFNYVLYPISHAAGNGRPGGCDAEPTSVAVITCHLSFGRTFVGF